MSTQVTFTAGRGQGCTMFWGTSPTPPPAPPCTLLSRLHSAADLCNFLADGLLSLDLTKLAYCSNFLTARDKGSPQNWVSTQCLFWIGFREAFQRLWKDQHLSAGAAFPPDLLGAGLAPLCVSALNSAASVPGGTGIHRNDHHVMTVNNVGFLLLLF